MELYLIRHPKPDVAAGVCYGVSDVGLLEDPAAAAQRLTPLLPPTFLLVSSPLSRCKRLAQALSPKAAFDPRLAEMDFGDWEMQAFDDIPLEAIDAWAADPFGFTPPGGESVHTMAARAQAALAEILEQAEAGGHQAVVIVAHGGPLRAIAAELLKLPQERWLSLEFGCGKLTRFEVEGDRVTLNGFNVK